MRCFLVSKYCKEIEPLAASTIIPGMVVMPLPDRSLGQWNRCYSIGGFWVHSWWWRWRRGRRRRVCVHKLHFPGTGISSSTMHQIHAMHGLASPSCMSPNLQFKFYCLDVLLRLGLGSFIIAFAKFNFTVTTFYCKETVNILISCSFETSCLQSKSRNLILAKNDF